MGFNILHIYTESKSISVQKFHFCIRLSFLTGDVPFSIFAGYVPGLYELISKTSSCEDCVIYVSDFFFCRDSVISHCLLFYQILRNRKHVYLYFILINVLLKFSINLKCVAIIFIIDSQELFFNDCSRSRIYFIPAYARI